MMYLLPEDPELIFLYLYRLRLQEAERPGPAGLAERPGTTRKLARALRNYWNRTRQTDRVGQLPR